MRKTLSVTVVALLLGCEPAQQSIPKTEPSNDQAGNGASTDHVWRDRVQALDKARAAAKQAGQAPAHEAP